MPFASARDGTSIHYRVTHPAGTAARPPVVLIQGLGLSGAYWFDLPETLAAHPTAARLVLTVDNRTTGKSGRPKRPFTVATMADDVRAVLDHAGVKQAVVAGISMGGMVAQEVALRHGEVVCGLVLLATTPGLPLGRLPPPSSLAALLQLGASNGKMAPGALRLLLSPSNIPRVQELMSKWPSAWTQDPVSRRSFALQLAACAAHSTGARLANIRCATQVVHGLDDVLVLPENSRRLAARIPHARLTLLPSVAHALPTEAPHAIPAALDAIHAVHHGKTA